MCRACAKLNVTTKNGERNECLWHVAGRSVFGSFFFCNDLRAPSVFWATRADSFSLHRLL